jgi:hypothetical protein
VELSNGRWYWFDSPRDVHASRSGMILYWFGPDDELVEIATEHITEVLHQKPDRN